MVLGAVDDELAPFLVGLSFEGSVGSEPSAAAAAAVPVAVGSCGSIESVAETADNDTDLFCILFLDVFIAFSMGIV